MQFTAEMFKRRIQKGLSRNLESGQRLEPGAGDVVDIASILEIPDDDQFLQEAYRRILGRQCDPVGFVHYRYLLRQHTPRRVILRALVSSPEARRLGVRVKGLDYALVDRIRLLRPPSAYLRAAVQRILALGRWFYRRAFLQPIEIVQFRLDYILQDIPARIDQLSKKLDDYAVRLQSDGRQLAERLSVIEERQLRLESALAHYSEELGSRLHQQLHQQLAVAVGELQGTLAHQLGCLGADLGRISEGLDAIRIESGQVREMVRQDLAEAKHRQAVIEQALAEARCTPSFPLRRPLSFWDGGWITEIEGFIVAVPPAEWRLAAHLAWRGPLEPGVTTLFRSLVKRGSIVVDVGAHFGWYTLLAARSLEGAGKVYSFEPSPTSFKLLVGNIRVNGFRESGLVDLRAEAVTDRCGYAVLYVCQEDSTHNCLFPGSEVRQQVRVPTVSLDAALGAGARVDLVKIDAEGAEPLVLRGMQRILESNATIRIIMEFAPENLQRAGVEPNVFLKELGDLGLCWRRIDDETGALREASSEEVLRRTCSMLLVEHAGVAR